MIIIQLKYTYFDVYVRAASPLQMWVIPNAMELTWILKLNFSTEVILFILTGLTLTIVFIIKVPFIG